MSGISPAGVPSRLSRRRWILVRGLSRTRASDPPWIQRLHRIATAGRELAPQQPRPGDRLLAEPAADCVRGLDGPAASIVVRCEEAELRRLPESVGADTDQADPPTADLRPRQLHGHVPDRLRKVGRLGEGPLARDGTEGAVANLHLDRGSPHAAGTQPDRHAFGEREERPLDLVDVARVDVEGVLMAHRLGLDIARDGRRVHAPGALGQRRSVLPEPPHQELRVEHGEVADRQHPVLREGRARLRSHAPEASDRQRGEEGGLVARRHDDQTIGLAKVRRDLRDELRAPDADRHGQPHLGLDGRLDRGRDRRGCSEERLGPGHVEERLVDRDLLHQRREAAQDLHHRPAGLAVFRTVHRQEDAVRAERGGGSQRHRGVDTEAPRLVARGAHDAARAGVAAHDHGPATELRAVALLDGREERVEVHVEDRRAGHAPIMPLVALLPTLLSLLFLAALASTGIAALVRFARWLTPLERAAYGAVLGIVAGTLALVPAATLLGFNVPVVLAIGAASLVVTAALVYAPGRGRRGSGTAAGPSRTLGARLRDLVGRLDRWGTAVVVLLVARWALLWSSALTLRPDGLWAGHEYIWSDWPTHLGIVTRFAFGGNFPPENTLFAGLPLSYHYLSDLTPAAFVVLGMDPLAVLPLDSFVLSILVALGLYAFARRLSGVRSIATLVVILFLFGAGLGWIATVARIDSSHDLLGTLMNAPWDTTAQADLHIRFFNPYLAFLMSQRAYLYGLPIAMLVVTLLVRAARRRATRTFVLAGVVAGLLPLAHLPTLLALAMVTPFLALLLARRPWHLRTIPWRGWIGFHLVWVAVAVPQLLMQLGGGAGALAAFRLDLGWVAGDAPFNDPWWWFWLKNLGLFIPLGLLALGARRILPPRSHRALLAFMPIFVVANTFAFQPWNWDNHKILIYWFLALTILVAALLVRAWRSSRSATVRLLLVGVVVTMTLGPALENLDQLEGHGQYRMLTTEQLQLC